MSSGVARRRLPLLKVILGGPPRLRVTEPFEIISPLTAQDAAGKLSAALAEPGEYYTTRGRWARWIVKGSASALDVGIRAWKADAGRRNSWRPESSGTICDLPQGGSELKGVVGAHPSVFAFSIAWLVITGLLFLAGISGAVVSALFANWRTAAPFLAMTGAAAIMALLVLTVAALGIRTGQPEGVYAKKWLSEHLRPDQQDDR